MKGPLLKGRYSKHFHSRTSLRYTSTYACMFYQCFGSAYVFADPDPAIFRNADPGYKNNICSEVIQKIFNFADFKNLSIIIFINNKIVKGINQIGYLFCIYFILQPQKSLSL